MTEAVLLASSITDRCLQQIADAAEPLAGSLQRAVLLPGPRNPHLLAAHDAARMLALQLRLLRMVWGGTGGTLPARRLPDLLRGAPGWERVRLDLAALPARTTLGVARARVVLAALLAAMEALPSGGTISIGRASDGAIEIGIAGAGAVWPAALPTLLTDAAAAAEAAKAGEHGAAAVLALLAAGLSVKVTLENGRRKPGRLRIGR
ncbi:MAG TPA: histidine phosphotransferase family protein [Acetobacteraceae bacterium]|nr:histidine phosphotransferase family protein [Acetobacteraceae bacterium]